MGTYDNFSLCSLTSRALYIAKKPTHPLEEKAELISILEAISYKLNGL